jgi:BirA family biotin operon repressor/biotin-[acetyl-CoA-carboxylase] ligase
VSVVSVSNTLDDIIKNTGLTIETKIKPPNDVFINNKKIAGIIIETSILNNNIQWLIMGVGININNDIPVEISDTAISLKDIIKQKTDLVVLLSELLNNLDKNLIVFTDTGIDIFLKEYKRKLIIN